MSKNISGSIPRLVVHLMSKIPPTEFQNLQSGDAMKHCTQSLTPEEMQIVNERLQKNLGNGVHG